MRSESQPALALPPAFVDEATAARWLRRAVTLPAYLLLAILIVAALPVLLPMAVVFDLVRRSNFATARAGAMLIAYLLCEAAGIIAAGALQLVAALLGFADDRRLALHYRLQHYWAGALFGAARRLYALRLALSGDEDGDGGPLLVFIRHASLADTLLPSQVVARRHGYRLRYVLKRELLYDACLDLVGNRLPNVFVRRASGDSAKEIDAIRRLATDLGRHEGVLIYPEGTRFSASKRERALARIAATQPARLAAARGLQHLLPPHLGGPLALLDAAPRADVLFVAHTGLESAATLGDLWRGAMIGRTVRVHLRRVPRSTIPTTRAERAAWLDAEWAKLDAVIDAGLRTED